MILVEILGEGALGGKINRFELNFRQWFSWFRCVDNKHSNYQRERKLLTESKFSPFPFPSHCTWSFDHWILPMQRAEFLHAVFAPNINSESFNWYPPVTWISFSICFKRAWCAGELNLCGNIEMLLQSAVVLSSFIGWVDARPSCTSLGVWKFMKVFVFVLIWQILKIQLKEKDFYFIFLQNVEY